MSQTNIKGYKNIKVKMKPKCFEGFPFGMTNEDELIPCCYCDTNYNKKDPEFKKLIKVSKVADYNKIDDILETKEWKEFYDLLINDIPPCMACLETCGVSLTDGKPFKEEREHIYFNKDGTIKEKK